MLEKKSAGVTGSTSGIGLGIARALAQQRADILLNGLGDPGKIEFTRSEMQRRYGIKVRYSGADRSQPAQIRAMAELAQAEFGKVDIVVNNAGIQHVSPIEDFDDAKWDAVLAINLSSAFHLIKAAVPGPGYVKTPLIEKQIADQAKAHGISPEQVVRDVVLSHQARKEFIQVKELAALSVLLASDAAASMTGTALAMVGGWTLH